MQKLYGIICTPEITYHIETLHISILYSYEEKVSNLGKMLNRLDTATLFCVIDN
jgi:hypothetical protein